MIIKDEEQVERDFLKNWVNCILDATGQPFIRKKAVFPYDDIRSERVAFIQDLEKRGLARILGSPETLDADDYLLEMLSFIDRPSSIPGFLD